MTLHWPGPHACLSPLAIGLRTPIILAPHSDSRDWQEVSEYRRAAVEVVRVGTDELGLGQDVTGNVSINA
jgi:hypothetical protein